MLPLATILHPTDFSEHSEFAFRLVCALARDYNAGGASSLLRLVRKEGQPC
jgi:hypothetical protein